ASWYHAAVATARSALAADVGRIFRDARVAIGWSQDALRRRSRVPQSKIARLERGVHSGVDLDELERIAVALGGRVRMEFRAPFLEERLRQRDLVHARCLAFIATRLERAGWTAETVLEIRGSFGSGWIDVLAWHP